jgi:hypothetical protein
MKKLLFLSMVAAGALVGCIECMTALAEAHELLLAMGDTLFATVGARGSPSIFLKRWPPVRRMAGRGVILPPMLAFIRNQFCTPFAEFTKVQYDRIHLTRFRRLSKIRINNLSL